MQTLRKPRRNGIQVAQIRCGAKQRVITIRCTRSRGPRGFFCLHDFRRGPVNVAVIGLRNVERGSILNQRDRLDVTR